MKLEQITGISGTIIYTSSGGKRAIGNASHQVGDWVWTDSKVIFGHEPVRNVQPYIPKADECMILFGTYGGDVYVTEVYATGKTARYLIDKTKLTQIMQSAGQVILMFFVYGSNAAYLMMRTLQGKMKFLDIVKGKWLNLPITAQSIDFCVSAEGNLISAFGKASSYSESPVANQSGSSANGAIQVFKNESLQQEYGGLLDISRDAAVLELRKYSAGLRLVEGNYITQSGIGYKAIASLDSLVLLSSLSVSPEGKLFFSGYTDGEVRTSVYLNAYRADTGKKYGFLAGGAIQGYEEEFQYNGGFSKRMNQNTEVSDTLDGHGYGLNPWVIEDNCPWFSADSFEELNGSTAANYYYRFTNIQTTSTSNQQDFPYYLPGGYYYNEVKNVGRVVHNPDGSTLCEIGYNVPLDIIKQKGELWFLHSRGIGRVIAGEYQEVYALTQNESHYNKRVTFVRPGFAKQIASMINNWKG